MCTYYICTSMVKTVQQHLYSVVNRAFGTPLGLHRPTLIANKVMVSHNLFDGWTRQWTMEYWQLCSVVKFSRVPQAMLLGISHYKWHNNIIEVTIKLCPSLRAKQFRIGPKVTKYRRTKAFKKRRQGLLVSGQAYKRREGPRISVVIRQKLKEISTPRQITNL